ncbi:type III-A CRISPR-associated protein Cas10/Csm1 [bacterium]|nr:MAG: type III-A CRISPR-associated protein Cas10/Csm1 [bacterium]
MRSAFMTIDKHDIAIAALLHDIGKVMQRAEIPIPNEFLNRCPTKHGHPTHLHVTWTEQFFEKFKYEKSKELWQIITNLAASHHHLPSFDPKEEKWLAQCIILADRISAKWDRKPEETSGIMYKKRPLYPVFEAISLGKHTPQYKKQLPIKPLLEFESEFLNTGKPYIDADEQNKKCSEYKNLYEAFEKEYILLMVKWNRNEITKIHFVDALDSLLELYFWCVPSNTIEPHPTNSLYHHAKTTAAVAVSLFDYFEDEDKKLLNEKLIDAEEKMFLLLGGDLSGIQSYIFDLNPENSKGTSKTLRARSFKVKILSEMTIYHIIKKLDITRQNILINAGGKFMILLPKKDDIVEKLKDLNKDIDETFFKEFQGMLSLNIDWNTDIAFRELGMDKFKDTLDRFMDNLEQAKKRKFSTYLQNETWNTDSFVTELKLYSDSICDICHRHISEDPEKDKTCIYCSKEIDLGKYLPKNHVGIISPEKKDNALISLFSDTLHFYMKEEPPKRLKEDNEYFLLSEIKDCYYIPLKPTATFLPTDEGDATILIKKREDDTNSHFLTFSEIAQCAKRPDRDDRNKLHGTEMLGVLKGDVDNLGLLFNFGLLDEENRLSLTSYSTFSGLVDFFFSQYIPALIEKEFPYIYVIYAGGDDFALVGPWNQVIDFIVRLYRDFNFFTCHNPDIHFSAGIEHMRGKAPIKNAIHRAEGSLEKAKNLDKEKNAITVFDTTVKWSEIEELLHVASQFQNWLENLKGFSTQFLYRLFSYHDMYQRFKSKDEHIRGRPEDLMYISYLHYDITRNISEKKNNEMLNEFKEVMINISQNNDNLMEYLRIPLSKVLYENR